MGIANQSITQGRTTLLDAVNILLENIGEQPINSLETEQIQDARIAERTILEFHKEGQTKGWSWNTEFQYPFQKDSTTKEVTVPANILQFALDPYLYAGRYQLRGQKVYDLQERRYTMETTVNEIKADVVWLLSWDTVPEAYNRWVTIRAARVFAARVLGSDALFKYTTKDEEDALVVLERMEQQQEVPNLLTGGRNYLPFPTYDPAMGLATRRIGTAYRL
tara:strand:- start:1115 stop:1777 length:663 start_codon:yes stop_codon:yes gene_type:complete